MKLHVTQENLAHALNNVARVAAGARNPLPVLSNVLLRTVDNRLTISATNLEIAITEQIGAKVLENGSLTVPAKLFQEYAASLPKGNIELESKDHQLHIRMDNYSSTINGLAADEFPVVPTLDKANGWKIPSKELKKALQQVIFAAAGDDTRPVLNGVYLHTHEGKLYAAATDSYRLAERQLMAHDSEIELLLPSSALNDLLRIIGDKDSSVQVYADGQQVLFVVDDSELVSRMIDGKYPDYRKLIPTKFSVTVDLDRAEFLNITKVASLFARESAGSIVLRFSEDSGEFSISSVASQLGDNTSVIKTKVKGEGEVSLNSRYLIDALSAMHGEAVRFACNGKVDPCLLSSTDEPGYQQIIMPLKS